MLKTSFPFSYKPSTLVRHSMILWIPPNRRAITRIRHAHPDYHLAVAPSQQGGSTVLRTRTITRTIEMMLGCPGVLLATYLANSTISVCRMVCALALASEIAVVNAKSFMMVW